MDTVAPRRLFCRIVRTHLEALGVPCETRLGPPMVPFYNWPWLAWRGRDRLLHRLHVYVYQSRPLLVLRVHVDHEEFRWRRGRALLQRHLCGELAPRTNDEVSFLPCQVPEVAAWLARAIARGDEIPNYYWWPGAAEERGRAYLRAAQEARE